MAHGKFEKSKYNNDVWFYYYYPDGFFAKLVGWMKVDREKVFKGRYTAHPADGPARSFGNPHQAEKYFIEMA